MFIIKYNCDKIMFFIKKFLFMWLGAKISLRSFWAKNRIKLKFSIRKIIKRR